jgi:hypothetical protein
MKRLLLLGVALILTLSFTHANALKVDKTFVALYMPIDTSNVKNGFNSLFLATVNGSNGARLVWSSYPAKIPGSYRIKPQTNCEIFSRCRRPLATDAGYRKAIGFESEL